MNYRNIFGKGWDKELGKIALEDARRDQNHARDYHIVKEGLEPTLDPKRSLRDELMIEQSKTERLRRLTGVKEQLEDELAKHPSLWLLITLIIGILGAEIEGFLIMWRDAGVDGGARILLAVASAGTTIFIPWITSYYGKAWAKEQQAAKEQSL